MGWSIGVTAVIAAPRIARKGSIPTAPGATIPMPLMATRPARPAALVAKGSVKSATLTLLSRKLPDRAKKQ
jgi:hypothetical protein